MSFDVGLITQAHFEKQNLKIHYAPSIDSTNVLAKESTHWENGTDILLTSYQPKGKGQRGNQWDSPKSGDSLLASFLFRSIPLIPEHLSLLIGLRITQALRTLNLDEPVWVKPPNDLYLKDKKFCGILVEITQKGDTRDLILGIGLNVFSPPSLDTATYIGQYGLITQEKWEAFLTPFYEQIQSAVMNPNDISSSEKMLLAQLLEANAPT